MNPNVTNRQLARWLAEGKGEWKHSPSHSGIVYTTYKYLESEADQPVSINNDGQIIMVRRWEDKEWHSPTRDYLFLRVEPVENDVR